MRASCGGTLLPPRKRGRASDTPATQRQRVVNIGASSSAWISTSRTACRMQVARHLVEREAVRRGERQDDVVLGRRRLQLEVELAAEALAQRQSPGAVDAAAVGRMHAPAACRRPRRRSARARSCPASAGAERRVSRRADSRRAAAAAAAAMPTLADQPAQRSRCRSDPAAAARRSAPRSRDTAADSSSLRPGASPSQNGMLGGMAVGVLDAHDAALDAQDAVGRVAELEDVARQALDREVLVHRADDLVLGLQQHLVVGIVGDGAAGGERGQPGAAPAAQLAVDGIVMDQRAAPAAPGGEAFGQHARPRPRIPRAAGRGRARPAAAARTARPRSSRARRPRRRSAAPARRAAARDHQAVELAAAHAVEQRRALDQLVARQREQPALGRAADGVARAADALQEARDRARRAELADEVDVADVDAELQRGGGDQRLAARRASAAARRRAAAPWPGCRGAR